MKIKLMVYAALIQWHCWIIRGCQKQMERIVRRGRPYTSPRLCRLDLRAGTHGARVYRYMKECRRLVEQYPKAPPAPAKGVRQSAKENAIERGL